MTRMTAPATTPDPTGLGGERIARISREGDPTIAELWVYPQTRDFEAIADAWYMHGGKATVDLRNFGVLYVRVERTEVV